MAKASAKKKRLSRMAEERREHMEYRRVTRYDIWIGPASPRPGFAGGDKKRWLWPEDCKSAERLFKAVKWNGPAMKWCRKWANILAKMMVEGAIPLKIIASPTGTGMVKARNGVTLLPEAYDAELIGDAKRGYAWCEENLI